MSNVSSAPSGHDPGIVEYESKPYTRFLEEAIPDLVKHDPVSIGIVFILPDGCIGTNYFNCDCTDIVLMANAMSKDEHLLWMKVNADLIAETLEGMEDDDPDSPPDTPDPMSSEDTY